MELAQETIHVLVDVQGRPTAVQIDWETWQRIVDALEDAEDIGLARAALAELEAAGSPEKAGWLRLEEADSSGRGRAHQGARGTRRQTAEVGT
jgi:hypothetical protein